MSGFERSAPIPGSQGPRRSQMHRYNNAPPPQTPWREEVLRAKAEAQKIIEREEGKKPAAERDRSRSREREQRRKPKEQTAASSKGNDGLVLRQARERGEGWFAAVARAAERWESVPSRTPGAKSSGAKGQDAPAASKEQQALKKEKPAKQAKEEKVPEKPRREEGESRREDRPEKDVQRSEETRKEREKQERLARQEFEKKAEERSRKADEERRRAEEERQRKEQLEKERKSKLKGAFAMCDQDDEEEDRQAALARKAAEKRKADVAEASRGGAPPARVGAIAGPPGEAALPTTGARGTGGASDPDLSARLRFEPGLSPAEAFMRLQERKRKGRRAEFGGPPRGCSPWRDGKRGISFQEDEK